MLDVKRILLYLPTTDSELVSCSLFTLMSAEGSRYNRGGFIEAQPSTANGLAAFRNADQLTIERSESL
ncbi:MAG TPA: hypothetical protein DDZ80_12305 [Cyanobacteria bacterium UBA8803]|nr:hypothetical protein [Cyanobacteria bacterium UBA9273]HBL59261.1 hypothetical protein [Cyanobacteria bacterium UBA8803]